MITPPAPAQAPQHHDTPEDAGMEVQSVARLVAEMLCGLQRRDDHFVRVNATLGDDGYIDVELTRVDFVGENTTMRVLLYPTAPVPIPPRSVPAYRSAG